MLKAICVMLIFHGVPRIINDIAPFLLVTTIFDGQPPLTQTPGLLEPLASPPMDKFKGNYSPETIDLSSKYEPVRLRCSKEFCNTGLGINPSRIVGYLWFHSPTIP